MDSSDNDYSESQAISAVQTTPSQRLQIAEQISRHTKSRVDNVATKRCLIENTDEHNAIQYAHCLARSQPPRLLTALEYHWNMAHSTLNLDTRYNIFFLSSKFHILFDTGYWFLVPENRILNLYRGQSRENFPAIDEKKYKYRLVATRKMLTVPIHRQNLPAMPATPSRDDFSSHFFPFHNLPIVESHVHPRFAIVDAGRKLKALVALQAAQDHPSIQQDLSIIVEIYDRWVKRPDNVKAFTDKTPPEPDQSETSKKTGNRRFDRAAKRKSRYGNSGGDESPTMNKRGKAGGGQANDSEVQWLDDETLKHFDNNTDNPKARWEKKIVSISHWVDDVSKAADETTVEGNNYSLPLVC